MKVRKGDTVLVIAGKDKGAKGKVLQAYPERNRVLVEGVNRIKKHTPITTNQRGSRSGGIVTQEAPIHVSNVMIVDSDGKPARVGYRGSRGEVAASYFRGFDDAPAIAARPGTPDLIAGTIPVFLDRKFLRLDVAGLDGELLFGPWIVRGEAGYFHYPDHQIDGYLLTEAEAEWSREGWQVTFAYGDAIGGNVAADVPAALDQALVPSAFLRVSKGDATEWQVGLDAAVGTKHGDSLVRFSGSYPFAGHVRVGGEVDLMGGEVGTFWGRWRGNDRVRVFSEFSF